MFAADARPEPPANIEAEQALLAAILVVPRTLEDVADTLRPDHFAHPLHGEIYAAIGGIAERGAVPTVPGIIGVIGAEHKPYLTQVAASVITTVNNRDYARAIVDCWERRQLMELAEDLRADAAKVDPERPSAVVREEAERRLYDIAEKDGTGSGYVTQKQSVAATVARIEGAYKAKKRVTGTPTGLLDLDEQLAGLHPSDLVIVAGRPGMGKSALGGTIAMHAAGRGIGVAFFSLEMTHDQLTERFIASLTGLSVQRQRRGDFDRSGMEDVIVAGEGLADLPIHHFDRGRVSVGFIRQQARRIKRRHGLGLVIIDHLQLIRQGGRQENRRLEIGDATGALKALAKELHVPVVLMSQLSRGVEQRDDKRPHLSDLRESGDIEQDADVVLFCYRHEYYLSQDEPRHEIGEGPVDFQARFSAWQNQMVAAAHKAEIIIAKNRHGEFPITVNVRFDGERSRFENAAREE